MYQNHPVFESPASDAAKLWRYMDFTKLVALLEHQALFFTRSDKFEDPYEGTWPRANVQGMRQLAQPKELGGAGLAEKTVEDSISFMNDMRKIFVVNCWHMNEHESAAMWNLYLKTNEGVAVQTTFGRLRSSLYYGEPINIGLVKYVDYETATLDQGNVLSSIVHKRMSFEHEREVRAVIMRAPPLGEPFSEEFLNSPCNVSVDLPNLVENIYVAPNAPKWCADLVAAVVKRYGFDFPVIQSNLYKPSLY